MRAEAQAYVDRIDAALGLLRRFLDWDRALRRLDELNARVEDPTKHWKLSPMDMESRERWVEYSRAKDEMFRYTDTKASPWYVVPADDKKRARLNCLRHLLGLIPYKNVTPRPPKLKRRRSEKDRGYTRPPITDQTFVPSVY